MSWLYVPGAAVLNSESASLSTISERLADWSVQWRGKMGLFHPTPEPIDER